VLCAVVIYGGISPSPGRAASPLPMIRCSMGNEDVTPPWFCKCLYRVGLSLPAIEN
jgi:hypothetical protein